MNLLLKATGSLWQPGPRQTTTRANCHSWRSLTLFLSPFLRQVPYAMGPYKCGSHRFITDRYIWYVMVGYVTPQFVTYITDWYSTVQHGMVR
jgi:hypothetical protein